MSSIFNMDRFIRLFYKHTKEHYRNYLMSLAVLVSVMILGGSFLVYMAEIQLDRNIQTFLFFSIMLLAGTMFTSSIFSDLGEKKKAIAWLILPASHFEKWLVAWLYSFLLFIILYTLIFYLAIFTAIRIQHEHGQAHVVINVFDRQILQMYLIFTFLHAVAFFGAVYFEKLHFIKTAFSFFTIMAALIIINKVLLSVLLGRTVDAAPPFGNLRFQEAGQMVDVKIESQDSPWLLYLLFLLSLLFWAASYFRLKEKQV
jgi:hypothetical protein